MQHEGDTENCDSDVEFIDEEELSENEFVPESDAASSGSEEMDVPDPGRSPLSKPKKFTKKPPPRQKPNRKEVTSSRKVGRTKRKNMTTNKIKVFDIFNQCMATYPLHMVSRQTHN